MFHRTRALAIALAATFAISSVALAVVTFDPATGTGFVGKGDVQTLLGLNNRQMQAVHPNIDFVYVATATYTFDCEWWTGPDHNLRRHENTKEARTDINANIASDSRKTGQWTGWHLNGYEGGGTANPVAEPTDADCGAEGNEMKSIVPDSIVLVEGSQTGGLFAFYKTDAATLYGPLL